MTNQEKKIQTLKQNIKRSPARSKWNEAVRDDAINLLDNLEGRDISERNLLKGAGSWLEYSEGGCALIWNMDIAERYATPYELELCEGGEKNPNSSENWIEMQARALYQANLLINEELQNL